MPQETQEHENVTDTTNSGDEEQRTVSDDAANSDDAAKDGEKDSSTSEAFDASSYEQSFGLPADTLKGVDDAESALKVIREYTDKTLTAGLLSSDAGGAVATAADAGVIKDAESGDAGKKMSPMTTVSKNPELDALRAELTEIKDDLATRDKKDFDARAAEIDNRVGLEIDDWASPKYGTSKSRNFKQAKAVKEFQELVNTHIIGFRAQGKNPPIVESLLRQVRAFHDDEYKLASGKKNSDAVLGSPGSGRSSKKDDKGPANIHEVLMGNTY